MIIQPLKKAYLGTQIGSPGPIAVLCPQCSAKVFYHKLMQEIKHKAKKSAMISVSVMLSSKCRSEF